MTTLKTYQADEFKNKQMNEESEHFRFVTMKVLTMQLNSIIIMVFLHTAVRHLVSFWRQKLL